MSRDRPGRQSAGLLRDTYFWNGWYTFMYAFT
jgi:hypothetical protein